MTECEQINSVLITGSNKGIGLGFVEYFLKRPTPAKHIFAGCRDPENAQDLQRLKKDFPQTNLHIIQLDVCNSDSINSAVDQVEAVIGGTGLNLLINNAGIVNNLKELPPNLQREMFDNVVNTNLTGPVFMTQRCLHLLQKAASSSNSDDVKISRAAVINVSSGLGAIGRELTFPGGKVMKLENVLPGSFGYSCSKAALNMATKLFSQMFGEQILFVAMCPGRVNTSLGGNTGTGGMPVETSVAGMMKGLEGATKANQGTFMNHFGTTYPW